MSMNRPTNAELFALPPSLATGTSAAVAVVQAAHPYAKMLVSKKAKLDTVLVTIGYVDDLGKLWVKDVTVEPVAVPTITETTDRPDQEPDTQPTHPAKKAKHK